MANFAVAASDEVINQGNRLLEKMALHGEKKADTLSRIFQIVSDNIDNTQMKQGGIDVQALDASLSNIRTMFLASVTGKEQIIAEKDAKINDVKIMKDQMEADLRKKVSEALSAKEQAEQMAAVAEKTATQALKEAEAAKERAETSNSLVLEKEKINSMLTSKLADAEEKVAGYDDLIFKEKESREQIKELIHSLEDEKKSSALAIKDLQAEHERAITTLTSEYEHKLADASRELSDSQKNAEREMSAAKKEYDMALKEKIAEMERRISDIEKDAALAQEKAISAKERELNKQIREVDKENARLLAKIESLENRILEMKEQIAQKNK